MKNTLIAIALLFTFQLNAQIPDSLDVDVPWDRVNLMSCDDTMGEGPKSDNDAISVHFKSDSIFLDDNSQCIFRMKSWEVVDWLEGETYGFLQIGKVKDYANTQCVNDMIINYDDFPIAINPASLLIDMDPTHEYAFSFSDEMYTSIVIDENSEDNLEIYVYDRTDSTVCKTNIYLTKCEDDVSLVFPETVEIEFNSEPYFELSLEMLGVDIVYPCGSYTAKISVGNTGNNLLFAQNVGSVVPVKIVVEFSNDLKYIKYINVNVTGIKPPPIPMFIEELTFNAGEIIELDIWSEEVPGLVAWQLQLQFKDVEILGIETSEMFDEIPFNILDDENTLKALWFPLNGMAIDAKSDATWFTLQLKPEVDGNTYDIFTTAQDPWSLIAIENELYVYEYEADFIFNVAQRDVLGVSESSEFDNVQVYPNPSNGTFNIEGIPNNVNSTKIEIYNLNGKLMHKKLISNTITLNEVDISALSSGLYILKAQNGKSIFTQRITKI